MRPLNAPMTVSAAFLVSAKITPFPCEDSSNLMTKGIVPTALITPLVSFGEEANPVMGILMPAEARS